MFVWALFLGCTSLHRELPGLSLSQPLAVEPLKRDEYRLLDPVEGEACHRVVTLLPLPVGFSMGSRVTATAPWSGADSPARAAALADALSSSPSADALVSPIWDVEHFSVPPWFFRTCASVRARAVEIVGD